MNRQKKLIKPLDGKSVPKKDGSILEAKGEELPVTAWWRRRARDGDVSIEDRSKRAAKPAQKPEIEVVK